MSQVESGSQYFDVVVLGGGAAGLLCAIEAAKRGRSVMVLEASNKLGKKILMSGGGRCNFTNLDVQAEHFICANPHFVKSALAQYSQWDFIAMVERHGVAYHEKDNGQLFCDRSARDVLAMLVKECTDAAVSFKLECGETKVKAQQNRFEITGIELELVCNSLVVASGGLSIPTLGGATGQGYKLAQQFGLSLNPTEASLVPMTLTGQWHQLARSLAGVSLPVEVSVPAKSFTGSMLFTHRGISGPAILQLSNYWQLGESISINLLPQIDVLPVLVKFKQQTPDSTLIRFLGEHLPKSLAQALLTMWWSHHTQKTLQQLSQSELAKIAEQLEQWTLTPSGTEGYRTAEVTRGGVAVSGISSKTMEVRAHPGLFFIGEVLDVTGHLGGFNFQWAWSSGYVSGINA